jgi:hypothetical protein
VTPYSLAFIDPATKVQYEHVVYANSWTDAETIAQLVGATVIGEITLETICVDCFSPLICPTCEDFEYEDH